MAVTIDEFKSRLIGGGARNNQFQVILPFPLFSLGTPQDMEDFSFLCKAASLPSSNVGTVQVPFRGRTIKVAGDRTFEDWTTTVINETSFNLRNVFERWSNGMQEHMNVSGLTNHTDYKVDGTVMQLDRNGDVIKMYLMKGIWPQVVSSIDVAYDTNDSIEEFQVTWSIDYWESETTT